MAFEIGGRADKLGNRFEYKWTVLKLLDVFFEKIEYVTIEAIGDDERGVDLWISNNDGTREGQQCKARNASKEYWEYNSIKSRGIIKTWKNQLERNDNNKVSLVSPLSFTLLEDLTFRAKNTNANPKDFLEHQIGTSGSDTICLFKNICNEFDLNPYEEDSDLIKIINYLSRIYCRQIPDFELKNLILNNIRILFLGEPEKIYDEFISYLIDGNILGRELNLCELNRFIKEKGIMHRNLDKDSRIMPTINSLNKEFRRNYSCFENGLITREETRECMQEILSGKSIIIHGKAGIGKSGCTENIIDYCEENAIPYIAIKLDKRIPGSTAELWANSMGLPASISSCLHAVSKNRPAVLILDQLDALRWTQAHSANALDICFQIIDEIKYLNIDRKEKISIVMVCRTYDYENDRNIQNLFKQEREDIHKLEWSKICVKNLNDEQIQEIIGAEIFNRLNKKLREIISIPSNLYIFEKLDFEKNYDSITTTHQLIHEWWEQLLINGRLSNLSEKDLKNVKSEIVSFCEKNSKLYAPLPVIDIDPDCRAFLHSNGFIICNNNKVSFVHQSILDCFLSEDMIKKYYNSIDVNDIIGYLDKQTPNRRYQVQMFMQQLLEISDDDFINAGKKMLESDNIRYNIKYVFLEILGQIKSITTTIEAFILDYIDDVNWGKAIYNSVISGRTAYMHILQKHAILDTWMLDKTKRNNAINLMASISPEYTNEDVEWIKKYIFEDTNEVNLWYNCLRHGFNKDSDELFELRMAFYNKHPELSDNYFDLNEMMNLCEMRVLRLLTFWLRNKTKYNDKRMCRNAEEININKEFNIKHYYEAIEMILPLIPSDKNISYSDWSNRYFRINSIERICINVLKKANKSLVEREADKFIEVYKPYFSTGNMLYNEILLDAFLNFPEETKYADFIINYLCTDFKSTLIENTSGNENELESAKKVIYKFSKLCSKKVYRVLEEKIIQYRDLDDMLNRHKWRIHNKENHGKRIYERLWGDLQKELLPILPNDRKSKKANDLLQILNRSFGNETTIYMRSHSHSGGVMSSISNKNITLQNWEKILTSKKIKKRDHSKWKVVNGGFIEDSIETISQVFSDTVSKNPNEMINFILGLNCKIDDLYIDAVYSGIINSNQLDAIDIKLLEQLFNKYPVDYKSLQSRAMLFCNIIERKANTSWSLNTLNILKNLAVKHIDPELEKPNIIRKNDEMRTVETLECNAINCVRGEASYAIASLLWRNGDLFDFFKETIQLLCNDENPVVQFASTYALLPTYNINKKWSAENFISLLKKDYRMAGFRNSKNLLFDLFLNNSYDIKNIVLACYLSDDKKLIQTGAHTIVELYMQENEFVDVINSLEKINDEQAEAIIEMSVVYFGIPEYNEKAKAILNEFIDSKFSFETPWTRLFYENKIDLKRDKEFLIKLLTSNISQNLIHSFVSYLESSDSQLIDYSDIILEMSEMLISSNRVDSNFVWGVSREISKLIIALYDETSDSQIKSSKEISNRCLDMWDLMYKHQIRDVVHLTNKIMEL